MKFNRISNSHNQINSLYILFNEVKYVYKLCWINISETFKRLEN